jgi:hypothetical protein
MLFPGDSNHPPFSLPRSGSTGAIRRPQLPAPGLLFRLLLWLLRTLAPDTISAQPVHVYYKFDSGCWRSRNTLQLHKVYRCR